MLYARPLRFLPAMLLVSLGSACPKPAPTPVVPARRPAEPPAPAAPHPPAPVSDDKATVLRWSVEGTLDGAAGACAGTARVTRPKTAPEGFAECWALVHQRTQCPVPDIDWLSEGTPQLCRDSAGARQLVGDIPGLGRCSVAKAEMDGDRVRALVLDCTWECRDQGSAACSGAAFYRYTP